MPVSVTMPMLGLTMEEGTVAEWLVREGDTVRRDEPLLTVEMDKGTVEVPAPATGVLSRILVQPGTTVAVRTPIAEIESEAATAAAPPPSAPPAPAGGPGDMPSRSSEPRLASSASPPPSATPAATPAGGPGDVPSRAGSPSGSSSADASASTTAAAAMPTAPTRNVSFSSPRARMRARELGVELAQLRGSGPHGRIVEADVLEASPAAEPRVLATSIARRLAQERGVDLSRVQGSGPGGRVTQDDVLKAQAGQSQPLSRIRRITAERMAASAQATARVTLFLEADFSEAQRFRQQLQPEFARLGVAKLPWDALIARGAALALADHRGVAAQWSSQGLQRPERLHIGIAVALDPEGLVVPVLRDAETRSLRELASDLLQLADKAKAGRLSPHEMQGGTFTITNLGAYRVDGFTPIINPPETAILGVGRIADKAVVVDGKVEARTMCTLSLSFDHRVVDGVPAAAFLARLAELLERPYALLGI